MKNPTTHHTFAASPRGILSDAQALSVGPILEQIEEREGCVKPERVVDAARPPKSPLHQFFSWDNAHAADLYRCEEARRLIRSVIMIPIEGEERPSIRAFVSVVSTPTEDKFEGKAYVSTERALSNVDYRAQVLEAARLELLSWRNRYAALQQFAKVFEAVDSLETVAAP